MKKWVHNWKEKVLFACNATFTALFSKKVDDSIQAREILVVKLDEIGDMVSATPVFESLRLRFPNAKISLLCKPAAASLMAHCPHVDHIFTSAHLWNKRYDLQIELRGNWITFFKAFSYPARYRLDRGTVRLRNKKKGGFLTDNATNEAIIRPLLPASFVYPRPSLFYTLEDERVVKQWLDTHPCEPFAIIHATANKPLKEWPAARFVALAQKVYFQYGLTPIFIGGKEEKQRIDAILDALAIPSYTTAGVFSLSQLFVFCKQAKIYVGNDSGPMHIAAVAGIPLIGLFGPGPAKVFYPEGEKVKIIHKVLPCNPCNQVHCVTPHHTCMQQISVEEVAHALEGLFVASSGRHNA
jgi:ADP-heptose:LPS heptosyltransferase